jgi:hypothetical protein
VTVAPNGSLTCSNADSSRVYMDDGLVYICVHD